MGSAHRPRTGGSGGSARCSASVGRPRRTERRRFLGQWKVPRPGSPRIPPREGQLIGCLTRPVEGPGRRVSRTFPARRTLRFQLTPRFGDPDLFAYGTGIPTVEPQDCTLLPRCARNVDRFVTARGLVATSQRRGDERTDTVYVTNRSRRSQRGYVVVRIQPSVRVLNASYRLSIKRLEQQRRPSRDDLSRGVLGQPRFP